MLEQELQYFTEHLDELLARHAGKFVVIKGDELVGVFDTNEMALREATRRFGLQSFLLRRVERQPMRVQIPALMLGVLNTDSTRSVRG